MVQRLHKSTASFCECHRQNSEMVELGRSCRDHAGDRRRKRRFDAPNSMLRWARYHRAAPGGRCLL